MSTPKVGMRIGAFAVAMAIGLAACTGTGDTPPVETTSTAGETTTAEEVATGFLAAYGSFDAERAIAYLARGADISELVGSVNAHGVEGTRDGFRLLVSLLEAQGYKQMLDPCEERDSSAAGTTIRCAFEFHTIWSDELGLGPYSGSYFDLTVRDGTIVRAAKTWETERFSPQVWEPFAVWVSAHYPEDVAVMYQDETMSAVRFGEESIRLWEQRSREYVDVELVRAAKMVKIAERFMRARNAYDAERAMSVLADGPVATQLLYDNALHADMGAVRLHHDELALAFEAEQLYGVRYKAVECHQASNVVGAGGQTQVSCSYAMDNTLRQIDGLAPVESSFGIGFRKGSIDHLSFPWLNVSWGPDGVFPVELGSFVRWLEVEHPKAGTAMHSGEVFRSAGQELIHVLTRKSVDLLARYLEEYQRSAARTLP